MNLSARIAFSTLAFPAATLAAAASLGPDGFTRAVQALKLLLTELSIPWR